MNKFFVDLFEYKGRSASFDGENLLFGDERIIVTNGIPRFTPDQDYAKGNFSLLREKHPLLQLDSHNGTNHRYDTVLSRTNWPIDFFKDKVVLECGCGVGADTEILVKLGCKVIAIDLAGSDIAKKNLEDNQNVLFVQGSILDIPFRKYSFDIVFCHRVIQHTPNPDKTLDHILQFVKDDGAVFVHSYARSSYQMLRWKYALRPITKMVNGVKLYHMIEKNSKFLFRITNALNKSRFGRTFCWIFVPFLNYRSVEVFNNKPDNFIIEYGIHDTFDALSPAYDRPMKPENMELIAKKHLKRPFELKRARTVTLLRTIINNKTSPS